MEEQVLTITGEPMAKNGAVGIQVLPLNKIKISRNSRASVSKEELDGLMQSIKEVGLLQPIGVIKGKGGGYEVCYGNRRFLACSKLGLSKIPAVIHDSSREFDVDIKNLTENIQRRNISLAEAGRYIAILKEEGLGSREVAVRLGVSPGYVDSCLKAYQEVPAKFRDDLEVQVTSEKIGPGKIAIKTARAILNAQKTYRLDAKQTESLFSAAKTADGFSAENVPKYAQSLKAGKGDFLKTVKKLKCLRLNLFVTEDHFDELTEKYVTEGPYGSVTALCSAVLRGEKNVKINIVK